MSPYRGQGEQLHHAPNAMFQTGKEGLRSCALGMKLTGVAETRVMNHVALHCRDLAAQEAFYTKHFGFVRAKVLLEGTPEEFHLLRLGSAGLELFPPSQKSPLPPGAEGSEQPVGFSHLAFDVSGMDGLVKALEADGLTVDHVIEVSPTFRLVFFRDPEGNMIELIPVG